MNFKERDFIPMLFGGDINTYSVARAFYERYKVKSYTFGKFATGPSYQSRIIEYTPNPKIDTDEDFYEDSEELLCQAYRQDCCSGGLR